MFLGKGNVTPVIALCLHRVMDTEVPLFPPLKIKVFEKLISDLSEHFDFLTPSEFHTLKVVELSRPLIILTFDDGYKDFIDHVMPVLAKKRIKANHNIVYTAAEKGELIWTQRMNMILDEIYKKRTITDFKFADKNIKIDYSEPLTVLKRRVFNILFRMNYQQIDEYIAVKENALGLRKYTDQMMNWEEIRQCSNAGIEIGSHTLTHAPMLDLNADTVNEIRSSKELIEQKLGIAVNTFAFPNGKVSPHTYQLAINAGYQNLLFIEGDPTNDDLVLAKDKTHLFRRLVGHKGFAENVFNIYGFHRWIKRR